MQTKTVRILLLNQVFHPDPQATSQYLSRLAEELVRRGHQVTVLAARRDYDNPNRQYPPRETWRGVEIIRLWNTGWGHGSKIGLAIDYLTFLLMAIIRGLLLKRADEVIALTSPPLLSVVGAILAGIWRARFVYWLMDLNPDEAIAVGWLRAGSLSASFLERASRWSLRRADRIIVLDRYMRDRLEAKGIPVEKIEVIPLWTQEKAEFFREKREQFREKHGLSDKYFVLYAGNHTLCHPLDTLVGVARLLQDEPRICFGFVGFGMEWSRLREQSRKEGWTNTLFLDFQPLETGLLSAADVQVVVMGDSFVGIIHPCKVYNFLGARRPFIYVGPEQSHVTDLIKSAGLEGVTASFRHGESSALADELRRRMEEAPRPWPDKNQTLPWTETVILEKMIASL